MKTVKLLLLLLLPAALFFASCQNELPPETFLIEENPDTAGNPARYQLSDVDYFELELRKLNPNPNLVAGVAANDSYNELLPYDMHLEKGEILRLEGLEPGYYRLTGNAYKINRNPKSNFDPSTDDPSEGPFILVGAVSGKSDRMYKYRGSDYIIVEAGVPVIVRFIFTGDFNPY
ncbi:MAG: hypothetical protein J6Y60_13870 [Treponema sp.]|nr:hypothetical protein [Treponema sp.]